MDRYPLTGAWGTCLWRLFHRMTWSRIGEAVPSFKWSVVVVIVCIVIAIAINAKP